jgi:predicted phage-related endonuclease
LGGLLDGSIGRLLDKGGIFFGCQITDKAVHGSLPFPYSIAIIAHSYKKSNLAVAQTVKKVVSPQRKKETIKRRRHIHKNKTAITESDIPMDNIKKTLARQGFFSVFR